MLAAVREILKTKGYSGLMVSKIASFAVFNKKLIYEYFESTDTLVDEYINSKDYWKEIDLSEESTIHSAREGEFVAKSLVNQFESVAKEEELQKTYDLAAFRESQHSKENLQRTRKKLSGIRH
ncbi:TetR/AcrR family transcriptional regulator [Chryseobacterium sp. 09-1422]|uniref:TetR/AcrR family transcriptional regulator n=1 Tax=Chryseobacterium kimseyorum TaxID=2984028 RepID=A0ABT3I3V5_9FLAO|nr:TetR/AcrR family transcriptional regulator [Chryseobacterium kimseyorum]MCW3170649.1 TetR/AcrR family transcriptional regulator [Chryseobacterium kimseyorum]